MSADTFCLPICFVVHRCCHRCFVANTFCHRHVFGWYVLLLRRFVPNTFCPSTVFILGNYQKFLWCVIGVNYSSNACITEVFDTREACITGTNDTGNLGSFLNTYYWVVSKTPVKSIPNLFDANIEIEIENIFQLEQTNICDRISNEHDEVRL
jgi:hypothetical protein